MSAVSRALPLSGDMTSKLHRENCRFASDTLNANANFLKVEYSDDWPVAGVLQLSEGTVSLNSSWRQNARGQETWEPGAD